MASYQLLMLSRQTIAALCGHIDGATIDRVLQAFELFANTYIQAGTTWVEAWRRFKRTPSFLQALDIAGSNDVHVSSVDADIANYRPMFQVLLGDKEMGPEAEWVVCRDPKVGWVAVRCWEGQQGVNEPGLPVSSPRDVIDALIERVEEHDEKALAPIIDEIDVEPSYKPTREAVQEYHLHAPQNFYLE